MFSVLRLLLAERKDSFRDARNPLEGGKGGGGGCGGGGCGVPRALIQAVFSLRSPATLSVAVRVSVREADSCLQQRFHGGAETHRAALTDGYA